MLEHLKQMLEVIVTDDELFQMMAKGMRKLHQALIAEGFTEEEATKIVASQGMNWLQGG